MKKSSEFFARLLVNNNMIFIEDINIYAYGIRGIFLNIIFTTIIFALSLITKEFIFTLSFYISINIIRAKYGSYHAEKKRYCFCYTFTLYLVSVYIINYLLSKSDVLMSGLLLAVIIYFLNLFIIKKEKSKYSNFFGNLKNYKVILLYVSYLIFFLNGYRHAAYGIFNAFLGTCLLENLIVNQKN